MSRTPGKTQHSSHYMDGYERLIANASYYATLDPPADPGEQMDVLMAYQQYAGQRAQLGEMYRTGQLTPSEIERLTELDRELLQNTPSMEKVYGLTLGKLMRWLTAIGTPLSETPEDVRIEASIATLAALVGVEMNPLAG